MANAYDGTLLARGDAGYEEARRATVWNARTSERYLTHLNSSAG